MPGSDLNQEILRLKLCLHRKLFSFIRISRTEEEIIHFIVHALWELFPESRVCFCDLSRNGLMTVMHSRQASGRQEVKGQIFDLNEMPEYLGRLREMKPVVLNLINNARDAVSQSAKRSIALSLKQEGPWAYLTVDDSGPGVPAKIRERIFQPFFSTKDVGSGTGLGLSISKGIVEAHGGKLYLDSSKGSRFVVKLPAEAKCKL